MWRSGLFLLLAACAPSGATIVDAGAIERFESILDDDAANLERAETPGYRPIDTRIDVRRRIMSQGPIVRTDRDLDLAIEGEGFFRIVLPDNTVAFTRAGSLNLDSQGNLVSSDGYPLDPMITISQNITRVVVDPTGLIRGFDPQGPASLQSIGQLELTRFLNLDGLETRDGIVFHATPAAGDRIDGQPAQGSGLGSIRQGFVELSSVSRLRAAALLERHRRQFDVVIAAVLGR